MLRVRPHSPLAVYVRHRTVILPILKKHSNKLGDELAVISALSTDINAKQLIDNLDSMLAQGGLQLLRLQMLHEVKNSTTQVVEMNDFYEKTQEIDIWHMLEAVTIVRYLDTIREPKKDGNDTPQNAMINQVFGKYKLGNNNEKLSDAFAIEPQLLASRQVDDRLTLDLLLLHLEGVLFGSWRTAPLYCFECYLDIESGISCVYWKMIAARKVPPINAVIFAPLGNHPSPMSPADRYQASRRRGPPLSVADEKLLDANRKPTYAIVDFESLPAVAEFITHDIKQVITRSHIVL